MRKWYFDELYSVALVRPALVVAHWFKAFDLNVIDGVIHFIARLTVWVSYKDGRTGSGQATLSVPSDRFDLLLDAARACLRHAWVPR